MAYDDQFQTDFEELEYIPGQQGLTPGYGSHPFYNVKVDQSKSNYWPGIIPTGNQTVDFLTWQMSRHGGGDGTFMILGILAGGILLGSYLYKNLYFPAKYGINDDDLSASVYKYDLKLATYGSFGALADATAKHNAMQSAMRDPEVNAAVLSLSGSHQIAKWSIEAKKLREEYASDEIVADPVKKQQSLEKLRAKISEKGQSYTFGTQYQIISPEVEIGVDSAKTSDVILISEASIDAKLIKEAKESQDIKKILEAAEFRGAAKFAKARLMHVVADSLTNTVTIDPASENLENSAEVLRMALDNTNKMMLKDPEASSLGKSLLEMDVTEQNVYFTEANPTNLTLREHEQTVLLINLATVLKLESIKDETKNETLKRVTDKLSVMQDSEVSAALQKAADFALRNEAHNLAKKIKLLYEISTMSQDSEMQEKAEKALKTLVSEAFPNSFERHLDTANPGAFSSEAVAEDIYKYLKSEQRCDDHFKNLVDLKADEYKTAMTAEKFRDLNNNPELDFRNADGGLSKLNEAIKSEYSISISDDTLEKYIKMSSRLKDDGALDSLSKASRDNRNTTNSGVSVQFLNTLHNLQEIEKEHSLEKNSLLKNNDVLAAVVEMYSEGATGTDNTELILALSKTTNQSISELTNKLKFDSEKVSASNQFLGSAYLLEYIEKSLPEYKNDVLKQPIDLDDTKSKMVNRDQDADISELSDSMRLLRIADIALSTDADVNRSILLDCAAKSGATQKAYIGGISLISTSEDTQMRFVADQAEVIAKNRGYKFVESQLGEQQSKAISALLSVQERVRLHKEINNDPFYMSSTQKQLRDAFMVDPSRASEVIGDVWKRYQDLEKTSRMHEKFAVATPAATKKYAKERAKFQEHRNTVLNSEMFNINGSSFTMKNIIDGVITPQLQRAQEEISKAENTTSEWMKLLERNQKLTKSEIIAMASSGMLKDENLTKLESLRHQLVSDIFKTTYDHYKTIEEALTEEQRISPEIADKYLAAKATVKDLEDFNSGVIDETTLEGKKKIQSIAVLMSMHGESEFSHAKCSVAEIQTLLTRNFSDLGNGSGTTKEVVDLMNKLYTHDVKSLNALFTPKAYHDQLLNNAKNGFTKLFNMDAGLLQGRLIKRKEMDLSTFASVVPEACKLTQNAVHASNGQEMLFQSRLDQNLFKHAVYESTNGKTFGKERDHSVTPDEIRNADSRLRRERNRAQHL